MLLSLLLLLDVVVAAISDVATTIAAAARRYTAAAVAVAAAGDDTAMRWSYLACGKVADGRFAYGMMGRGGFLIKSRGKGTLRPNMLPPGRRCTAHKRARQGDNKRAK